MWFAANRIYSHGLAAREPSVWSLARHTLKVLTQNTLHLDSSFRSTPISGSLKDVIFDNCEFEHIEVADDFLFGGVKFLDSQVHGLTVIRGEEAVDFYDPATIDAYLSRAKASLSRGAQAILISEQLPVDDERIKVVRKLLLIFRRSTQVSDSVITLRLGVHASKFFREISTELLESGILRPVKNRGGGNQLRFRLGRSMAIIAEALANANGHYPRFLQLIQDSVSHEGEEADEG
jgi:hypothetical protein